MQAYARAASTIGGDARREDGWLGDFRQAKSILWSLEAETAERS
jgi:hypothetical protein